MDETGNATATSPSPLTELDIPTGEGVGGESSSNVIELALVFLKLGTIAFGGPAAHIALMRLEFVDRRRWLTEAEFLDLVGAANLIPGPSSTEVAIFIGYRRAGIIGLLLAGLCFILPAALIVAAFAAAYVRYGRMPVGQGVLYGVKPVIIAIVVQALWTLGKQAIKSQLLAGVGIAGLAAAFLGLPPLAVVMGGGVLASIPAIGAQAPAERRKSIASLTGALALLIGLPLVAMALEPAAASHSRLITCFLVFAKIGSVVYGSGYVLLAFLKTDLVTRLHWLTSTQLLDSVAVGQFTPGPVFTTATFIGYLVAGPMGAVAATVGIFAPAFLFVGVGSRIVPRLRQSSSTAAFLDGVNVGSLALMAVVTWQLGRAALVDGVTILLALGSAFALLRFRWNSAWLVAAGAVLGLIRILVVAH